MSSVTFPTAIGGDGSTVTDDDNATTGLRNGGWRTRFIPCFTNLVNIADYVVTYTASTTAFATPPPIGSTTPNTGAFTRVTVTGSTAPANGMYLPGTNSLGFATNSIERVRIDASGNVGIGTTSAGAPLTVRADTSTATGNRVSLFNSTYASDNSYPCIATVKTSATTTAANVFQAFYVNAGAALSGYITANGANAAGFASSSDARLKENITSLPDQLANICALKPSEFDFKDGSGHQIGFIAQEMEEVYPDCVDEDGNGMLTITGWSKTEARLVKAIQELASQVSDLSAELNEIKARLS